VTALTTTERLRRAVAEAARATERAHDAAWRARLKLEAVTAEAETYARCAPPTLSAFVKGEATRMRDAAFARESDAWSAFSETGKLAELLGADTTRTR
jgi:hypothetical protein